MKKKNRFIDLSKLLRTNVLTLFSCAVISLNAQSVSNVTIAGSNVTIKNALEQIEKQTGVSVGYDESVLNSSKIVHGVINNASLSEALDIVLNGSDCTYTISGNYVVIQKKMKMSQVNGIVCDLRGEPLIGAAIQLKGKEKSSAISDIDGKFTINAYKGAEIEISFLGFVSQTVKVSSVSKDLRIVMKEDIQGLNEVVVIGYGSRAKKDVTTSISSMASDKISSALNVSPEMAMQGQMSGVQIVGNIGDPNSRPTIRIRGTNTWGVADPLIVIDGIPVKEYGAGVEDNDYERGNINIMSMIDPNDIESISVLKDAASAAIYGVRASNGVVLITTKKGKREKTQVEYSQKISFQNQWQRVDLMDTPQYADYFYNFFQTDPNWIANIDPKNYAAFSPDSPTYLGNSPTYDWQSATQNKNAMTQDYSVRVSGGTERADYSASFSYADYEGVKLGNDLERYSGAFKLNTDINKYVRTGINVRISYASGKSSPVPSLIDAAMTPPWQPIYDENGYNGYAGAIIGYNDSGVWDPTVLYGTMTRSNFLGQMTTTDTSNSSLRLMGNAYLEIEPIKNLKLKGTISMDNFSNNVNTFNEYAGAIFSYAGADPSGQPEGSVGSYEERVTNNNNVIYEFTANYKFDVKKHNFDLLFNMMGQHYNAKYTRGRTEYMTTTNPDLWNLGGENQYTSVIGTQNRGALVGMLFRLSYNYDYKYYLDATVRRDGSSRFAPKNRWGVFPGVSAGWRISKENFLEDVEWIEDIKLRASWGQLGNQEVQDMAYLSKINTSPNYAWGYNPSNIGYGYYSSGATVVSLANEGLSWERTTTTNAGIDFTLLDGLNGSFEYYHKMTSGILQPVTLPGSVGLIEQPVDNIASVKNTGVELNLNYAKNIGDFSFSVGGNFTTVKNTVVKMYNGIPYDNIEEGYSMNYIRGYVVGGMFQSREEVEEYISNVTDVNYKEVNVQGGDFWFKDMRGAPLEEDLEKGINRFYSPKSDGIVDDYDRVYLGKTIPGFYYGFNISCDYKGIDFSAQFTGVGDVQKINQVKKTFLNTSAVAVNQNPDILNAWTEENTNTNIPRIRYGDPAANNRMSSYYVEDADYLRLANLQIGYTLPQSVYRATKNILNYARIYIGTSNLFTITKYTGLDPEDDYNPAPRVFYTGLSLRF